MRPQIFTRMALQLIQHATHYFAWGPKGLVISERICSQGHGCPVGRNIRTFVELPSEMTLSCAIESRRRNESLL